MIALIAAIIFSFASCGDSEGSGSDDGGAVTTYTVTFNSNGGTAVVPITGVASGSTITEPTAPKKGYAFAGWYKEPALTTQWVFASDIVTANITLYAKWGAYDGSFSLGETGPGGGKIFYVSAGGFTMTDDSKTAHYFEAATSDQSTGAEWGRYGTTISGITTFTTYPPTDDELGRKIGNGRKDTQTIVTQLSGTGYAAELCYNKRLGNGLYNDWFLPSVGELYQLYINRSYVGIPSSNVYWSSSQYDNGGAWYQNFDTDFQIYISKNNTFYVRAIRAF